MNSMDDKIFRVAMYILAALLLTFGAVRVYKMYYDQEKEDKISGNVILYTKEGCRYCTMAKNLLDRLSISFEGIEIGNNLDLQKKLVDETGQTTVPYVFVKDHFIGGYSDLVEMNNNGKLLELAIEQSNNE